MSDAIKRSVVVDGREICYLLERKKVKNLNLRVRKNGSVFVSVNAMVPCREIDKFIRSKGTYVLKAIDHFREMAQYKQRPKEYVSGESFYVLGRELRLKVIQTEKNAVSSDGVYISLAVKKIDDFKTKQRLVARFLELECKTVFGDVMECLYPLVKKYGIEKPTLKISEMETRWGSCLAKKKTITLNKRLLEAPRNCIEYVMMHELCHLMYPNHSRQFYSFLTMLMPDWRERKAYLDKSAAYWVWY